MKFYKFYKHARNKKAVIDEIKNAKPEDWEIRSDYDGYREYSFRLPDGEESFAIVLGERFCEIRDYSSLRYGDIEEYLSAEESAPFLELRSLLDWRTKDRLPLVWSELESVMTILDKQEIHDVFYAGMKSMAEKLNHGIAIMFDGQKKKHYIEGYRREDDDIYKPQHFTWQEVLDGKAKNIED